MAYDIIAEIENQPGLITVNKLAELLGVGPRTIYEMVSSGNLPTLILPGCSKKLFDPKTISYWLRKHNPVLNQVRKEMRAEQAKLSS